MTQRLPVRALYACASLLLVALAGWLLSCGGQAATKADLVVTSFAPAERSIGSEPIQLSFDRPVVTDEEVGEPLATPPVTIKPALVVDAHWLDRQTLVLTPKEKLKPSTRYEISLSGDLSRRTNGFSFKFVHDPLVVDGVLGMNLAQLALEPVLPMQFNQSVIAKDVAKKCHITAKGSNETISLALVDGQAERGETISVKAGARLRPDSDYELSCNDLRGADGDVPLDQPYVLPLHTHPRLAVQSSSPGGSDVPADDVEIEIEFTTPVDLEVARKHIHAKPAIPSLDQGWLDGSGTHYKVVANLKTTTPYAITVDKDLTDTYGQKLEQPFTLSFTTGDARPRLSLETGIFAVETAAPGYPVWTRNVRDFDLECAAVPRNRIVKLLTSALDYDPWYDASDNQELEWKSLGLQKQQKRIAIDQPKNKWHLSNLALHEMCGGKDKQGLFLAEIASRDIKPDEEYSWRYRPHRRVLANVTDLGVLLKAGTGSGLIWVTQISTGKPVAGARVTVYSPQGRQAFSGQTDPSGILRLPGSTKLLRAPGADDRQAFGEDEEDYYSYRSQRLIAVVEKGSDMAVVDGNWANGIQTWNFGVTEERRTGETRIRGFIQSDRGIYRPGETVHFKGLVREIAVGRAPVVPRGSKIKIHIEDSRGQDIFNQTKPLSEFGGFSFDLPLEDEANLGDYYVTATIKGQDFRQKFSVEEFRKASFEVDVAGSDGKNRLGDKLAFQVDANYLFGAPVVGGQVEWNVSRRAHSLFFPGYEQYSFADYASHGWEYWYYSYYERDDYGTFVADGTGTTDRNGRFRLAMRDPQTEFDGPQDYILGVTVRDETDQAISKRTVVTAHKTDFYLGLHAQEWVQAEGMPFAVNLVALDAAQKRVPAKATLRFIRQVEVCEHSGEYRSYASCKTNEEVEIERAVDVPAAGTATERIFPSKAGEYIVRIEGKDSRGNAVVSSSNIWVLGKGEAFWSGDESARVGLIASKADYQPGETAKLVARAGLKSPTALVTIERDGIIDAFVKPMASATEGIEVKIADTYAPNVFASVALVSGRSGEGDRNRPNFKMGITELKVSADAKRLAVDVAPEKPSYEPGEEVSAVVRVTSSGQPVRAEVAISVADEGVLQLIGYKTPDPMSAFYASWGLGVDNATNWNRISRLNDPTAGDPDMGGDSGGEDDSSVRSNFVSSAFWQPSMITDQNGEVRFTFKAPDNLTAFRIMAVAADTGSRFGSGEKRFTIKKPLLAKPVLPRFLNSGDRTSVGVLVHNYTDNDGIATVSVTAKGVHLGGKTSRQVTLAKDGSVRVDFPMTVEKERSASFEMSVAMGSYRDALRLEIPINQPLTIDNKTLAVSVAGASGKETVEVPVSWAKDIVANQSVLSVNVDRTGLSELEPSLRYLIEYPYGCLEQTLSRFIPLTKVKDLASSLQMDSLEGPKLDAFIRAGVAKVAKHQHADGHFSLWPSGETYPHLTVYALYGLIEAKRAKIKVPEDTIKRGMAALQGWVGQTKFQPGGEAGTLAMAAYVLAELGKPDTALNTRLYEARAGLPQYGKAFLLRAMHRARAARPDITTLENEMTSIMTVREHDAEILETMDLSYWMSSNVRSTAIGMSALLEVDPQSPFIDKLAEGLKKKQQPGGGWHNTQENLYSLVALSDYARKQSAGTTFVTLSINGKKEITRKLDGAEVLSLRRYLHNYQPGTIKLETTGKVRYAVRLVEAREDAGKTPVNQGFTINREYVDPKTGQPIGALATGQLVKVRVTIESPDNRRYVAVVDPLPSGFEAINTSLATESNTGNTQTTSSWNWSHKELRDDRAYGFIDRLPSQHKVVWEYLVRATTPGTFAVPSAHAEEMYSPQVYGRTTANTIKITR